MKKRLLHIALMCVIPLLGWCQSYNDMVTAMTELSLPLINLEVDTSLVSNEYFTPGNITIAELHGSTVTTSSYHCQLRYRGMLALTLPKKAFSIKLVDEQGEKLDANLLGLRTDNTWILDAMGYDKLRMRNRLCFDIWNQYSITPWDTNFGRRNGTVGSMVEVFINGEYHGIYCLSDKINRQLLNLKKVKEESDGTITVRGVLYKGNGNSTSNTLLDYYEDSTDSVEWNQFELQYPDDYPSQQAWQPLIDLIDFNSQSDDEYFTTHFNEWYYIDNLADYWVLIAAFGLKDMPYKNTFLSTPNISNGHRYMITPWDLDACLGRKWGSSIDSTLSTLSRLNYCAPFNRLVPQNINGFRHNVAKRWFELTLTVLSPTNIESYIRAMAQRFVDSGAWQREFTRWRNTKASIGRNISDEVEYAIKWYKRNFSHLNAILDPWREDYDPYSTVSAYTITQIYNYLLGIDTTFHEGLDYNKDGAINVADITIAYNIILGINQSE